MKKIIIFLLVIVAFFGIDFLVMEWQFYNEIGYSLQSMEVKKSDSVFSTLTKNDNSEKIIEKIRNLELLKTELENCDKIYLRKIEDEKDQTRYIFLNDHNSNAHRKILFTIKIPIYSINGMSLMIKTDDNNYFEVGEVDFNDSGKYFKIYDDGLLKYTINLSIVLKELSSEH